MRHSIAAVLAASFLASAAPAFAHDMAATEEANKKLYRGFVEQLFNKHDLKAIDKYCALNFVDHSAGHGQKPGLAGTRAMFAEMLKSTPNMKVKIEDVAADGDRVMARITMTGTPKAPMMGMQPSGKSFTMSWIDWITVKNGKMAEHWGFGDSEAMMQGFKMPGAPDPAGHEHKK